METFRCEGVILQALNFQDYDRIVTVFSLEEGLIKLIIKGANRSSQRSSNYTNPFTRAEFVYSKGKSEIYKNVELSLINQHLHLRQSLQTLEAASDIAQAVLKSQLLHTPAPDLYKLLVWCLEKMPLMIDPYLLAACFRLKLLRHDGLLNISATCASCAEPLEIYYLAAGETFCSAHVPSQGVRLNSEELVQVFHLAHFGSLSEISAQKIPPPLREKVACLFQDLISQ